MLIDNRIMIDNNTYQCQYYFVEIFSRILMSDKCQLVLTALYICSSVL